MNRILQPGIYRILILLCFTTFNIQAANVTWLSSVNGNWNDGTKWSGGVAPGVNDTAVIDVSGTYTVTLNVNASVAKIVLGGTSGIQTLSSTSTILTIANLSMINSNGLYSLTSATLNGSGSLQNDGTLQINSNNSITVPINNNDTIVVRHSNNSISGAITTSTNSLILMNGELSHSTLTFSNGFTNNGLIKMTSTTTYYSYMTISSGILLNAAGATIQSDPNPTSTAYHRIDGRLDNQGTMNINYNLRLYSTAAGSTNTGSINIASGKDFIIAAGIWNYDGGAVSATGRIYFENATGRFNTAIMPAIVTYFASSTLATSLGSITSASKIQLANNNSITASLLLNDTLQIMHQTNSVNGAFSTTASSVILMDGSLSHSIVTFANGFINNGLIKMTSSTTNYSYLTVTSGVLVNASLATIQSDPNPTSTAYHRIDGRLYNLGTVNINFNLRLYSTAGGSDNTGIINIAAGKQLIIAAGIWNWNGGTALGSGQLSFENSTGNFNTPVMPDWETNFSSSTLGSTQLPLTCNRVININNNNTISAAVFNTDTIKIHGQSNTMTGALTTSSSSILLFDGLVTNSIFTISAGFTNNGKILFNSTYYYVYFTVSAGVLTNSSTGIIQSTGNPYAVGYYRLDAALNNLGLVDINYLLYHYTNAGASHNTGTVNINAGKEYRVYNGQWHWDGGTATGTGLLSFYSSATGSFNTPIMPAFQTYFNQSTLASILPAIANSKKIRLSQNNSVTANLQNTDSILIQHSGNNFSGSFSNTASSVLWFDGVESNSLLTFSNGFTNNGKILFDATYYYGEMTVSAGVLINAATGIIKTQGNPYAVGYYRLNAAVNNLGSIDVNYLFYHYTTAGASHNTGTVIIAATREYRIYNGLWHWDGGTATGTGLLSFYSNATGSFNTATMPPFVTYFTQSTLASTLPAIANSKKIRLGQNNNVTANLQNTDSILVQHSSNSYTGNFSNTPGSVLWFDGAESHSVCTFTNGFTNNGKILFDASYYYGEMTVSAGVLNNAATGIIKTQGNPYAVGYYRLNAAVNNLGTIDVGYLFYHYTNTGASHTTGTVNIAANREYRVYQGQWHWDGGSATGTGLLSFYASATGSFNTDTMPPFVTYFKQSVLTSTLSNITNSKKIRLANANNIPVNLLNSDSIVVQDQNNSFNGNYTNTTNSVLWFDGAESHSTITFANGFTCNGKILFNANYFYGRLIISSGTMNIASTGSIIVIPTAYSIGYYQIDGNISNSGLIDITYPLYHASGTFSNNSSGIIKGTSYLNNNAILLTNSGTISPGSSPGILDINAKIKNTSSAIWNIEIGGLTAGTQHDQIDNDYTSTVDSINGTLNINLINGFVPALGDSVIIEKHLVSVGTFANIMGQAIPGGLYWNIFYRTNRIVLRAGNPPNLDIVSTSGSNGTISPLGTTSVVYNGTQTYNFIPNPNYIVDSIYVDGVYAGNANSYTFNNVIVNHTIHVTFRLITWTITTSTNGNGTISPSGSITVFQGNDQTFNFSANSCFILDSVIVDGIYVGASLNYTFTNVTADHTIYASFSAAPHITSNGSLTFCAGDIRILDAGAGYISYVWSTGATTQAITVNSSGIYTCTITGTGGCTASASKTIIVNALPNVTFSQPYPTDNGHTCITDGALNLTTSNLGQPIGGSYSGTGVSCVFQCIFNPSSAGLGSHSLTYTYTDINGCSASANNTIIVDQNATVDAGPSTMVLCNTLIANLNGNIGGIASSGTWTSSGNGTFNNANALNAIYTLSSADSLSGTVTLTLTTNDPTGPCGSVSDQIVIYYNPDAVANAGVDQCSGATVSINGIITGYAANPLWTTLGTGSFANANANSTTYNASVADLSAGFVNLVLTPIDPNGNCVFTADTVKIYFDPQYSVNAGNDQIICNQTMDTVYLLGVTSNVQSVSWSTNGTGSFGNINLAQTFYVLSALDKANGSVSLTITSDDPAGPCSSVSESMILKYKYAFVDAGADVCGDTITSVSSSVLTNALSGLQLNYQWITSGSGSFTSPNAALSNYNASNSDIAGGSVKIYVSAIDLASECIYNTDSMTIWFNKHYSIDAGNPTTSVCANSQLSLNGIATNVSSVTWTSSGDGSFANVNALVTTYTPGIADSTAHLVKLYLTSDDPVGACSSVSDSITVTVNGLPHATAGTNSPVCIGSDLDLTASGGISYLWSGPNAYSSSMQNIIRSNADLTMNGTYTVTVTDINTCTATATTIAVVQNCGCTVPVLSETHVNPTCFGSSNGSIDLTIVSGVGIYTYQWSNGATTEDINGLSNGTYICTVSAGVGCTDVILVNLNQSMLSASLNGTNVSTYGNNDGAVTCTVSGGTSPYSYNWNSGQVTQNISGLTAGTYMVTVTDFNGCTVSAAINITQPGAFIVTGVITNANSCLGASTGAIDLSISNGTGPFTYLWNDGVTTEDRINSPAGTYTVTITNSTSGTVSSSFNIQLIVNTPPSVAVNASAAAVCMATTATLNATGAVTYTWMPANGLNNTSGAVVISSPSATTAYTVTGTDANGCTATAAVTVTYSNENILFTSVTTNASHGGKTGVAGITFDPAGCSILWNTGETTNYISNKPAGTYTGTVTSPAGCVKQKTLIIN